MVGPDDRLWWQAWCLVRQKNNIYSITVNRIILDKLILLTSPITFLLWEKQQQIINIKESTQETYSHIFSWYPATVCSTRSNKGQCYKPLIWVRGGLPQLVRPQSKESKVKDTRKKEMIKNNHKHLPWCFKTCVPQLKRVKYFFNI